MGKPAARLVDSLVVLFTDSSKPCAVRGAYCSIRVGTWYILRVVLLFYCIFSRMKIRPDKLYLSSPLGSGKYKSCVVGMANVDSAYLYHCCASIDDFMHPDLPALLVFVQFITQLEVITMKCITFVSYTYLRYLLRTYVLCDASTRKRYTYLVPILQSEEKRVDSNRNYSA